MKLSIALGVLMLVATGSASQSLLQALLDSNDPLLLDEHKAKRVAESWAKGKANKGGSSKTNPFSQFNLGLEDYDNDEDLHRTDGGVTELEAEEIDKQYDQQKDDGSYNDDDDYKQQGPSIQQTNQQEQSSGSKECSQDVPTYRMYSVLAGCGTPIDQEVVKPVRPEPVKPEIDDGSKHQQETLAHYVQQVGKDKDVGQIIDHQQLGSGVELSEHDYYNQENKNTQANVVEQKSSGEYQHKADSDEVYELPFVQTSGNDRILEQEGQHNIETGQITDQHEVDSYEIEEPFVQTSANDRILGQTSYEQSGRYEQFSGQQGEQVLGQQSGQIQTSGQYEQNVGQVGQVEQGEQQGEVSLGGGDDSDEFGYLTDQFWHDSDESKENSQVAGQDYSQSGRQEQVVIPGQQITEPEFPERLYQQTGNDGSYHLRSQSGNDDETPRRAGWNPSQQYGSNYNTYYGPSNVPRPNYNPYGTAGVGSSYNGGGPLVSIPNPNQIGTGGKFSCLGKGEGYYVDYTSDCRRFYRCAHGDARVFEFQCGGGTKFDISTSQCAHSHEVHCKPNYYM